MGIDETARNPVQPSLPRSVPCCASPRRRGAQGRASPTLHRPRRLPRRAMHAMFPSACCCTRWCRRTTGRQRAHRPLRPRDTSPAAQPKAKPQADPKRPRSGRLGLGPLSGLGGIGHGRRGGTAPRGRNPTHRRPIRHQTGTKPALVRPPPTRQTGPEGCLNFLYSRQLRPGPLVEARRPGVRVGREVAQRPDLLGA